jgi:hypothetical protein
MNGSSLFAEIYVGGDRRVVDEGIFENGGEE